MQSIFNIISIPFGYVMAFIYGLVGNYGLSIILFTLLAKLVTLPLSVKTKRSMMDMQRVQPKLQALQKKYANDKAKMNEEMQKLYESEGVSPMAGCGSSLLALPIMLGLYYVISQPLSYVMHLTADEIASVAQKLGVTMTNTYTGQIGLVQTIFERWDVASALNSKLIPMNYNFLGLNLAATPSFSHPSWLWLIPILSGLTAYLLTWVQKKLTPNAMGGQAGAGSNLMLGIMMPLMSIYFGFILPAGLVIYWVANNIFTAVQEYYLTVYFQKKQTGAVIDGDPNKQKK